jgi:hypothetical protein
MRECWGRSESYWGREGENQFSREVIGLHFWFPFFEASLKPGASWHRL